SLVGKQAQRHAMADAAGRAFPDDAIVADAEANVRVRARCLDVGWTRTTHAQQHSSDAAIERRGEGLVDKYRAAVASILDCEQRTVRQNGNGESGVVADAAQVHVRLAGGAPAADVGGAIHACL